MTKSVAIVGAGINGLLTAFFVTENYPDLPVHVYDAEKHPADAEEHKGVTHGSRDARHITGSESIGFENSIHKNALRNSPGNDVAGWLLKAEAQLTVKEKQWRNKFEATYAGSTELNELDFAHAGLNYKGLAVWNKLIEKYNFVGDHVITNNGVDVYFKTKAALDDDFAMETEFCRRYFDTGHVRVAENDAFNSLYSKKLVVPGMSIRIKSLALDLLRRLEKNKNVSFHWEETVKTGDELEAGVIVWTSGVTHAQPSEYREHDIQGIVGCWITVPNQGYRMPFKIASPAPSAYINFTPDGDNLHISGGFGWTGEHTDTLTVSKIAIPIAQHFIEQVNQHLDANVSTGDVAYCVRPSTPTGQPLLISEQSRGKTNIYITGSAKSGMTHAPVLSEYALRQINI